jgi:hypothetical protein
MTAIQATLEHGNLLLDSPLPKFAGRVPALIVISDEGQAAHGLPAQKLGEHSSDVEEEFEAIGLRDFFGNPVDKKINWDKYFSINK